MKQFYNLITQKFYYLFTSIIIFLMIMGLFVANPQYHHFGAGMILHICLVAVLSICLLLYPKHETHLFRIVIILICAAYFYTLFFLYSETWSTFIFLCFIPAISILFFDSKLFYFSLVLNSILIFLLFGFFSLNKQTSFYTYIKMDLLGNLMNFIASQVMLFFIFYLASARIKKQQMYYEQIQQTERLKTTGQLAAAVAHEIRNPLTVVKGFLQLFEKDASLSEGFKKNFSLMIDEINTAEHVISQFLTIAKPDKDKRMETVDVAVVLQSVTDLLKSYGLLHDNHIELKVVEDCLIAVNVIEFKQLVINLIKNAIEASKVGDTVHVKTEKVKNEVEIQITDDGNGMSEEVIKSLGTPFYSLKSKGTGLGLMICYNIVEKYNGTIQFISSIDKGTTVVVRFPYHHI
ncbi:HAMP domain-containing histidine kinase [Bacillus salipaludis]|uniref:histidine kinase n=1 Tax=Bacillus salipaludis TaxID=2547811 RepID=A0A4R5VV16_9BACI|nr:HAMP domain-containing sensor histidine kinase [Bacillus salipaludis]TDK63054.1 HAMP domain-containing histidine kinase [Bacillus salipaludis]